MHLDQLTCQYKSIFGSRFDKSSAFLIHCLNFISGKGQNRENGPTFFPQLSHFGVDEMVLLYFSFWAYAAFQINSIFRNGETDRSTPGHKIWIFLVQGMCAFTISEEMMAPWHGNQYNLHHPVQRLGSGNLINCPEKQNHNRLRE